MRVGGNDLAIVHVLSNLRTFDPSSLQKPNTESKMTRIDFFRMLVLDVISAYCFDILEVQA